jgi:hypothetical protein
MRVSPTRFLCALGVVVVIVGAAIAISLRATAQTRAAANAAQAQDAQLRAAQLRRDALERVQPATATLEQLERDVSALTVAQAELVTARAEFQRASLAAMRRGPPVVAVARPAPGRADPAAVLQSVIRAVADGEAGELVALIDFDEAARAEANALLAELPADVRAEYVSVEHLVASVMGAKTDARLSDVRVDAITPLSGDESLVRTTLVRDNGTLRPATFRLRRNADGWRLRVPVRVIEGYRALVTGVVRSPAG